MYKKAVALLVCLFVNTVFAIEFGTDSRDVERQIVRANNLTKLYASRDYGAVEKILRHDIDKHDENLYIKQHLLNELADLYSEFVFDLEKAIECDKEISKIGKMDKTNNDFYITHTSANNISITNMMYVDEYINVSSEDIINGSMQRLDNNNKLINAQVVRSYKDINNTDLVENFEAVKNDLTHSRIGTSGYFKLVSRWVAVNYELYKRTSKVFYLENAIHYMKNVAITDIDYGEIELLTYIDFLMDACNLKKDIIFGHNAIEISYKPYLNLRSTEYRKIYNTLINTLLNKIIDVAYKNGQYYEMLYYISMNKSRMIEEERFLNAIAQSDKSKTIKNLTELGVNPIPSKQEFFESIRSTKNYLDFYIDGSASIINVNNKQNDAQSGSIRAIKQKTNNENAVYESGGNIYITYIKDGKPIAKKHEKKDTETIKSSLDDMFIAAKTNTGNGGDRAIKQNSKKEKISNTKTLNINYIIPFAIDTNSNLVISADKWMQRYPYDAFLNHKTTRIMNAFLITSEYKIDDIKLVGYFDPTKDLEEAMQEEKYLTKIFPSMKSFAQNEASLQNIRQNIDRNMLHLSMHGSTNEKEAQYSKLYLSNSNKDDAELKTDANALYAKDMPYIEQLKNNKLVFTAACSTGLTKSDTKNDSEILGILRPLLTNNNEHIILTLWDVNSVSAMHFVKHFYSKLNQTRDISESFFYAQEKIKNEFKDALHWAPYYLISSKPTRSKK